MFQINDNLVIDIAVLLQRLILMGPKVFATECFFLLKSVVDSKDGSWYLNQQFLTLNVTEGCFVLAVS